MLTYKRGCVFPMVIWPPFRMGQYRANDHPYHALQFISFILLKGTDCIYPNLDVDIGTYLSGTGKWKNYHCQFYLSQVEPFQKRRIRNSAKIYECLRANKTNQLFFIETDNWQEKQQNFLQFSQIM